MPSERPHELPLDHPIIGSPWTYTITELHVVHPPSDEPYLDLVLRKDDTVRRLRFLSPQNIHIREGAWSNGIGLEIFDVSSQGLERLNVKVDTYETSDLHFWARTVIDLDALDAQQDA